LFETTAIKMVYSITWYTGPQRGVLYFENILRSHGTGVYVEGIRTKLTIRTKFTKKGKNFQKSFLMAVVYLRYILVLLTA